MTTLVMIKVLKFQETMLARKPLTAVFGYGALSGLIVASSFFTLFYTKPKIVQDNPWSFW